MAVLISPKREIFIFTLVCIATLCCYTGYAEDNPVQMVEKALFCFNNNFIYTGCDEAYRLNESGNIDIPPEATDQFCTGPCLTETQLVLNCVDNEVSHFLFYNEATIPDVRNALRGGCSYTSQRGDFNVARYIQSETGNATSFHKPIGFFAFMLTIMCCFTILYRLINNSY